MVARYQGDIEKISAILGREIRTALLLSGAAGDPVLDTGETLFDTPDAVLQVQNISSQAFGRSPSKSKSGYVPTPLVA